MILVVGSSGLLGGMITRQLLAKKRPVRILVRSNPAYQSLIDAGAESMAGDLKEPASLAQACAGIQTVITTANSAERGGGDNPETVDWLGTKNLVDAAKAAGVKHFIYISALSSDINSPQPILHAKAQVEQYIRESGIEFTILRPNISMDVLVRVAMGRPLLNGSPVTLVGESKRKHSFVAAQDVAAFAVAAVTNPAARNQSIVIGGPQPESWLDIVETAGRITGQEIPLQYLNPGEPLPGLPSEVGMVFGGLMAHMNTYDSPIELEAVAKTYVVTLTSLESFLRGMLNAHASRI